MDNHDIETKKEHLRKELLRLKKEGFRVFVNKSSNNGSYVYGLITDNVNIIYVEYADSYETLFSTYFKYVPDKATGSGCSTLEPEYGYINLTKEVFEEAVKKGRANAAKYRATLYRNFEHYWQRERAEERYVEL